MVSCILSEVDLELRDVAALRVGVEIPELVVVDVVDAHGRHHLLVIW
jgi:hypothetical protein